MLAKQSQSVNRLMRQCVVSARFFSADAGKDETAAKKENAAEWGIKYNDECLKFEKEWKEIAGKVEMEQMVYLEKELGELQRKKVDMLADKMLDLNIFEMRYLAVSMKERIQKTSGINPLKLNMDWPSVKQDAAGTWPPLNPNWFKQQDLMSQLGPFMGSMGGGGQAGGAPAEAEPAKADAPPEAKVEKTHFDVELSKFDAASKIKVIKEIRAMMNLGLKEAKELVEASPQWIAKEMKKEDAEAMMEKLKAVGAECKMV